ncbi:MAG: UvrD-helicase domain-containing protein [Erysipelotrichaceae bacterium]|nr:UvrD-helicase domain-containing protein [Erysipelotrichaceae bacterium]MCB9500144.1 UvrD-helicase domain-containing protein [Erysipelotrichaceae bacterium]
MNLKEELNEKQYQAVVDDSQYLRIIAGAGSGKTRVLTFRIAHLIQDEGIESSRILAFTFTNKVANEMKVRAAKLINQDEPRRLNISTFHSWCARFLRQEIGGLGLSRSFAILDDEDQKRTIKLVADEMGIARNDDIVKDALKFIQYKKMEGKLPGDVVIDSRSAKSKQLLEFFVRYEKKKNSMNSIDFDDLIIYSVRILKTNEEVRIRWDNKYDYILVDEFQDTNDIQFELLTLLAKRSTSIYVVGDPDQTIYTWRGANQKVILDINKIYMPMKTIILDQNYRSTSTILSASNELISYNKERVKKDLFTLNGVGDPIDLNRFTKSDEEGRYVVNTICELKKRDPDFHYGDIAVLYRSSYLSLKVENALTNRRIAYKVYGGLKFYQRKVVKDCLAYFRLMVNEDDDVSFERIINVPRRKIGDTSLILIKTEAEKAGLSMIKYLKSIQDYQTKIPSRVLNSINDLFKEMTITQNKLTENLEAYSEVLNSFLQNIGYIDYIQLMDNEDEGRENEENVEALIEDVRTFLKQNPESSFIDYLENTAIMSAQDEISDTDCVTLMTIHTAKGLEFKYVFLIGLAEAVFPNARALDERSSSGLEEERRLCYVAFTRAKKHLYLSYNEDYNYATTHNNIPSRFIKEAGLKPKNNFVPNYNHSSSTPLYRMDLDKPERIFDRKVNTVDLSDLKKVEWSVGDVAIHKTFGEGKIISVEDDIIVVDFVNFGEKTLMGNHPFLTKKNK